MKLQQTEIMKFEDFEISMLDDDVIYMHYFEDTYVKGDQIEAGFAAHDYFKVSDQVKRIVHCEKNVSVSSEARELVQKMGRPAAAEAYIIPELHQKILFKLYHMFRKRNHPLKAFDNVEQALQWLHKVSPKART